jgi:hypothetical protein
MDFSGRIDLVRGSIKTMTSQIAGAQRSGDLEYVKELKHDIERCENCLTALIRLQQEQTLFESRAKALLAPYSDIVRMK